RSRRSPVLLMRLTFRLGSMAKARWREPPMRRDVSRGMTLIEVLVALAIVAITLAAGFKAAGGLTVNAQRLTDLTVAQWCAENHLANIKLSKQFPGPGDSDFQCEQLGRELR